MRDSQRFRDSLRARMMTIAGASSVGLAALAQGCGSEIRVEHTSTSGDAGSGGQAGHGMGGNGTGGSIIVITTSSSGGGATVDAGPMIAHHCLPMSEAGVCPEGDAAMAEFMNYQWTWCQQVVAIVTGPNVENGECCYDVEVQEFPCYVGRTFFVDQGAIKANLRRGSTWARGPRPNAQSLPPRTREALADAWSRDGLFEHASVASFARFSMQLLALGAPADLVRDTHAAILDEVRHAELCLALASEYAGYSVEPAELPFPAPIVITPDLAAVVTETVMEGCIGETVAAMQAYESLLLSEDPAVREVLEVTVEDETRHAELAFRFVAWALDVGGNDVRNAVIRALAGFRPPSTSPENLDDVSVDMYRAHGRIPAREARIMAERALQQIVVPCICALLSRVPASIAGPSEASVRARLGA
ncbi:MAG TPA: ferritin-like domain-containing protein [Polyangium sp.]|nr:ferritin-like domain-containing protein [Polyangium sp.]